ncbi:hypothetical protein C8J56DRAFT_1038479 [Mycena floridula]|nr:hypothetical protein C8J56DRAFT_1038479 [Mycena floridula]
MSNFNDSSDSRRTNEFSSGVDSNELNTNNVNSTGLGATSTGDYDSARGTTGGFNETSSYGNTDTSSYGNTGPQGLGQSGTEFGSAGRTNDFGSRRTEDNDFGHSERVGAGGRDFNASSGAGVGNDNEFGRSERVGAGGRDFNASSGVGVGNDNEFSGSQATDRSEFGSEHTKPKMGDKLRGTAEELVGKATKNPELIERGQERKTGIDRTDNF